MSDGQIRRARKTMAIGDLGRKRVDARALAEQSWHKKVKKARKAAKLAKQARKLNRSK